MLEEMLMNAHGKEVDAAARTVFAPQELPVGVVTALVGVPIFIWILARRRRFR